MDTLSFVNSNGGSNYLRENMDRRAVSELDNYYRKVKNILTRNRPFLDAVVEALKEKRVLTYKDIEQIKANVNIVAYTIAKMSKNYK